MTLKHLSDAALLFSCQRAVAYERDGLLPVLKHLMEIDRRRLVKIYEHATSVLKYAEDEARKRQWAMRFLREFPHTESRIASGDLNLTLILLLRSAFKRKQFSQTRKIELIDAVSGMSSRKAADLLAGEARLPETRDSIRAVSDTEDCAHFSVSKEFREKLETFRGRVAHRMPHASIGELLEEALDLAIVASNKEEKSVRPRPGKAAEYRAVFTAANSKCEVCGSTFALEEEHIVPKGRGGGEQAGNKKCLCRWCNQRAAIREYGAEAMEPFLKTAAQRFSQAGPGANEHPSVVFKDAPQQARVTLALRTLSAVHVHLA